MPTPPAVPPIDPVLKVQQIPAFLNIVAELDLNRDQLNKRQNIIREIESELSSRHNASNKMISYMVRFGHARALMNSADIAPLETILSSISGAQQINVLLHR